MATDPSLPPEPLPLTEASVQEIQLELIRRRRFNNFDGRKIVASLRQHRALWKAVYMDRLGFVADEKPSNWGLIKLRDLSRNSWNVDDLFILAASEEHARAWQQIAERDLWDADSSTVVVDPEERARHLGTSDPDFIVNFWWD